MKLKEIVEAYALLGKAKVVKLDDSEVVKVLKARATLKPHVDAYESYLKDCQEKFKPENWDEVQHKLQQWQQEGANTLLTEGERIEVSKIATNYQKRMDEAIKPEMNKEIQISLEKFNQGTDIKMMKENGWTVEDLEVLNELRPKL